MSDISAERRVEAVLLCQPWDLARIVGEDDETLTVVRGAKTWTLSKARDRYMISVHRCDNRNA